MRPKELKREKPEKAQIHWASQKQIDQLIRVENHNMKVIERRLLKLEARRVLDKAIINTQGRRIEQLEKKLAGKQDRAKRIR